MTKTKNYKVTSLLAALSEVELKQFLGFAQSDFLAINPKVIQLLEMLAPHYPEFELGELDLRAIYLKLYPEKNFNHGHLRNLMTSLVQCIFRFMQHLELEVSPQQADRLLLKQLSKRKLDKVFNDQYNAMQRSLPAWKDMSRDQFLEQHLSLQAYYNFPLTEKRSIELQDLNNRQACLDRFFTLSMLQFQIELKAHQLSMNKSVENSIYESLIPVFIKSLRPVEKKLYSLCQMLIGLHDNLDKKQLEKTIALYKKQYIHFPGFDNKFILQTLVNLKNKIFREDDANSISGMFDLYKFGVQKGILFYDKSVTITGFFNIVTASARTNQLKWATKFINSHWQYLPLTDRDSIKILATALVNFEKGKFDKIIKELVILQFNQEAISYRHRMLMAKCHVEIVLKNKKLHTEALNQLNAFEKFARRQLKKKANRSKTAEIIINFIRITRKIIYAAVKENASAAEKIRTQMSKYSGIAARNWLHQKLDALE